MAIATVMSAMWSSITFGVPAVNSTVIGPVGAVVEYPAVSIMPGLTSVEPIAIRQAELVETVWWRCFNKSADQYASMSTLLGVVDSLIGIWQNSVTWGGSCTDSMIRTLNYDALYDGKRTPLIGAVFEIAVTSRRSA